MMRHQRTNDIQTDVMSYKLPYFIQNLQWRARLSAKNVYFSFYVFIFGYNTLIPLSVHKYSQPCLEQLMNSIAVFLLFFLLVGF